MSETPYAHTPIEMATEYAYPYTSTVSKQFTFSASHQLTGLPEDHPCSRLHGHNYIVEVTYSGVPDEVGFVIDYRDLEPLKRLFDDVLDHRHLNDVVEFNPTAENLSRYVLQAAYDLLVGKVHAGDPRNVNRIEVAVSETPKTWARLHVEVPEFKASVEHGDIARFVAPLDPHEADADRYRWNFTTDGGTR